MFYYQCLFLGTRRSRGWIWRHLPRFLTSGTSASWTPSSPSAHRTKCRFDALIYRDILTLVFFSCAWSLWLEKTRSNTHSSRAWPRFNTAWWHNASNRAMSVCWWLIDEWKLMTLEFRPMQRGPPRKPVAENKYKNGRVEYQNFGRCQAFDFQTTGDGGRNFDDSSWC